MNRTEEISLRRLCDALQSDCLTLALRLYGEDPYTMAPETLEVMDRWRPRCEAAFREVGAKIITKHDDGKEG